MVSGRNPQALLYHLTHPCQVLQNKMMQQQANTVRGTTINWKIRNDDRGEGELSGPLRLRVQSRSRTRLRIAASIAFLFRASFKGLLDTN